MAKGTLKISGADAFTAADLAPNSVDTSELAADAVTGAQIEDNAVDSEHIAADSIDAEHYAAGSVDATAIANDAVDSQHYTDGSIDNAHIADDAIDSEHYAAGSIDTAHIADDAVTGAKIENSPTIASNLTVAGTSTLTGKVTATAGIAETGGALKENLLTNSGFDVWSTSDGPHNAGSDIKSHSISIIGTWATATHSAGNITGAQYNANASSSNPEFRSTIPTVKGRLYRYTFTVTSSGNPSTFRIYINGAMFASAAVGANQVFDFKAVSDDTLLQWLIIKTNSLALTQVSSQSIYEIVPGCVGSTGIAADTHSQDSTLDSFRQTPHATYTKGGSHYSLRTVNGASDRSYYLNPKTEQKDAWLERIAGRTLTFGVWAYTTTGSHARIGNYDGSSYEYSSYAGTSAWEWLEITRTFGTTPTYGRFFLHQNVNSADAYFSQPMLVFGKSIGEGNYTRPQGEWIYCEEEIALVAHGGYSTSFDGSGGYSTTTGIIDLAEHSGGKIPAECKAVRVLSLTRDSGSASGGANVIYRPYAANQTGQLYNNIGDGALTMANSDIYYNAGQVACDADGNVFFASTATGSSTMTLWFKPHAIQLH